MITRILGVFLLALAVGGAAFSQASRKLVEQAPSPRVAVRDFDEALHKSVIYPTVRVFNTERPQFGTGVVIRSEAIPSDTKNVNQYVNVMLTCAHCITPHQNYTADLVVYESDGTTFKEWDQRPLIVYHHSPKHDIAIGIFVTNYRVHVATIDFETRFSIGNEILHVGCGAGEDPRFDKGQITGLKGKVYPHPNYVYRTNMMTVFGDSGGPAYYKNKLIGLMQAVKITRFRGEMFPLTGISFCIPVGTVKVLDNEQNNTLSFVYNLKSEVPKFPVAQLKYEPIDWDEITQGE